MMDYVRRMYGVPAKRGGLVRYEGKTGKIVGSRGNYLRIRLDGEKRIRSYHPTDVEYIDAEEGERRCGT